MILFGILFTIAFFRFDRSGKYIFAIPCGILIIFYSLSFDLIDNKELGEVIFKFQKFHYSFRTIFYFFVTCFGILIGIILTDYYAKPKRIYYWTYNKIKLKKLYYLFAFLSLTGFLINFSRIYSNLNLLFVDPREYEKNFGANPFINYLYFLNVPTLCLWVICKQYGIKLSYTWIINPVMIVISFFHGIKFTIFDTFLYPMILYYMFSKKLPLKSLLFIAIILIGIFILFGTFIRGGSGKSPLVYFLGYILPNYYNLGWIIENQQNNIGDFASLVLPEYIPSPTSELSKTEPLTDLFIFNPTYNMFTGLHQIYNVFNLAGPLIVFPIIFRIQQWFYYRRNFCLTNMWISVYFDFCLYFVFYFYSFVKLKNIYFIVVFYLIDHYCRVKKVNE